MACAQAVVIRSAPYVARRHADVPRDSPLRMALDEWDRDEASERIRAYLVFPLSVYLCMRVCLCMCVSMCVW